ncbi:hypothetical protein [Aestuariimicrobium ganziense]|uniref:hypothetical protein n=1 Tax=Aestuariimicrobium ganziense TaxID=2773677 RepID=UPI0019445979|nr:hypothetical protein [Aestuariimicrobium ganziense]
MALYAASGRRRTRQVLGDLFALAWCAAWIWVGTLVFDVVDAIATPARRTAETSADLERKLHGAGDKVGQVPAVGDELATPFRDLATGLSQITSQANDQAAFIHDAAWVVAIVIAAIPVLMALALRLPGRIRFARESSAAQRFIDADPDLDLFALRAMTMLPMSQLAGISDDPVGAWRRGDRRVIDQLAALELGRVGLKPPIRAEQVVRPDRRSLET